MKNFLNSFINVFINIGDIILKFFRYFFIGCYSIFTNRLTLFILVCCLLAGVIQISTGFREEILKQEQEMIFTEDKVEVNYYYDEANKVDYGNDMGITELIDCYQSKEKVENMPDNVIKIIDELETLYNSNSRYFSFLYQDLFSGFTVGYNVDGDIFTASTIKAPAMIYIYEMASVGKIDLNEKLVYTSNFYHGGSGILQTKPYNTEYTVDELVWYTVSESDNIAYKMLNNRFGQNNIRDFWRNFGTKNIFENNTIWGYTSATDAMIYMRELYNFSIENEEYGGKLLDYFKKAKWKMITGSDGTYNTANKGGWSGDAIHDVAIVFDENPYILVVMSNMGNSSYNYLFNETSKLVGHLHNDYWKYKVDICSNIKLY